MGGRGSGGFAADVSRRHVPGEREKAWHADPVAAAAPPAAVARGARAYTTGLLMTLLNPMTLAFWFVAVPALAVR